MVIHSLYIYIIYIPFMYHYIYISLYIIIIIHIYIYHYPYNCNFICWDPGQVAWSKASRRSRRIPLRRGASVRSLRRNRQRRRHWRHRASQLRRRAAKRWRCRGWKIMDFEATTTGDANTTMSPLLVTFVVVLGFTALTCCTCYSWRVVVPLSTHGLVALSLDTWILDIYGGFFIVRLGCHRVSGQMEKQDPVLGMCHL